MVKEADGAQWVAHSDHSGLFIVLTVATVAIVLTVVAHTKCTALATLPTFNGARPNFISTQNFVQNSHLVFGRILHISFTSKPDFRGNPKHVQYLTAICRVYVVDCKWLLLVQSFI